jgi:hypothetical protein
LSGLLPGPQTCSFRIVAIELTTDQKRVQDAVASSANAGSRAVKAGSLAVIEG